MHNTFKKTIYAPNYYTDFKCIADKCRHSCCIDWEICIDADTCAKYEKMSDICDTTVECEDGRCFALCSDGRCPHLNDKGLCNIIINHGEKYLSEICKNHPRFFNCIDGERVEAGLGIVCEEACRMILENENPFSLSAVEEFYDGDFDIYESDFDPIPQRNHIISYLESERNFNEKIASIKREFGIPEKITRERWAERFLSLEILDADWKNELLSLKDTLFKYSDENADKYGKYYVRLLTYFVYRHVSTADRPLNFRARLGFAILSLDVVRSIFEFGKEQNLENLIDIARRYSSEIEYSEDNTEELIFAFESEIL